MVKRRNSLNVRENTQVRHLTQYYEEAWESPRDPRDVVFRKLNQLIEARIPWGNGAAAADLGAGKGTIVSFLINKGFQVTAVEVGDVFVDLLKRNYPAASVVQADLHDWTPKQIFDTVTMIEVTQNLTKKALRGLLQRVYPCARKLHISISNASSFHGVWVRLRNFKADFVHWYTPKDLERLLAEAGFRITYRAGIGLVTPVTLLADFKFKLIPRAAASWVNRLDPFFPKLCHLYYVEAEGGVGR